MKLPKIKLDILGGVYKEEKVPYTAPEGSGEAVKPAPEGTFARRIQLARWRAKEKHGGHHVE